jgi:hypothetical protein
VITPSVTPVYNNNPGFGMLLISDGTLEVSKFYFTFLQLEDYHRFKVFNYERYDPAGENNINLNNADSVRDFQ